MSTGALDTRTPAEDLSWRKPAMPLHIPNQKPIPVWTPYLPPHEIPITQYRHHINRKFSLALKDSQQLQKWSTTDPQAFWVDLWSYVGLIPDLPPNTTRAYDASIPMDQIPPFFEDVRINYAENVLTQPQLHPDAPALIQLREGQGLEGEAWSWTKLREQVRQLRSALVRSGVQEGDRVAALISTSNWSVAILLAAASIGAIFSSIASDLGEKGCIMRLQQIKPMILFADSHVTYKGRQTSNLVKISKILSGLQEVPEVVIIPLQDVSLHTHIDLDQFMARSKSSDKLEYKRLSFSAPLYILYSSGTTGPPKCLVHQHGAIIQHKKIAKLHNSLKPGEVVFQYSSTSWVLWNIMIGHLSVGTTLIMYDGSPTFPTPQAMLEVVQRYRVNYWGCSPKYLQALQSTKVTSKNEYDISSLRMVQSGGSHLAANQYHWFYKVFPPRVHLTSVTGGTDLVTSWIGTDPAGPLYAGELQIPILGHDIDVADPVTGHSIKETGESGEFVCRQPFPSMPVFFWGDKNHKLYRATYFDRFDFPVWAQHDWISFNPMTGGSQVHGRSDGVLNPQGIRFGSAEIYSITEAEPFDKSIETTLCVGRRRRAIEADESVFLFVIMRSGHLFTSALRDQLKHAIRSGLSSRHVPRFIIQVDEFPMTVNGKKIETLVKEIISTGETPKTVSSTVANPQCLDGFRKFYALEDNGRSAKL